MALRVGVIYLGRRGSGGRLALDAARALSQRAEVFAVTARQAEHAPLWATSELEYFAVDTFNSPAGALWSLLSKVKIRALAAEIAQRRPDVLLFPMLHPWNAALQARLARIPAVVMVHDAVPHPGLQDRFYAALENRSIRRAALVAGLSRAMLPALATRGAGPERARLLPLPAMALGAPPAGGVPAPARLLFFGRIEPYKGLEMLLQAYALLDPAERPPLRIAGAGSLAPYRALLEGLPPEQVRVDNRWWAESELAQLFTPGTILVLPYTSASQSGVIELAAAYRLAVIASAVGGVPEQVEHGQSGLLVPPGDAQALAGAVRLLAGDPQLAARMGESLARKSQAERGWEVTGQRLYDLLAEAAAKAA